MRYLAALFAVALGCQYAPAQPTGKELITNFRKTIGADAITKSVPFLIQYRGQRYLYSVRDGKLEGDSFDFDAKLYGYTGKHNVYRKEFEMKIGVVPFKFVEVIQGDSGWFQWNEGDAVAMSKRELAGREQREVHVEVFLGREFSELGSWQFSEAKSMQVRGQDAWTFEAKKKGIEPLALFFVKESGLLLRLTSKATDFAFLLPGEKKPKLETFTRDVYFSDWKKVGSRMMPGHIQAFNDGMLWQQMQPVSVTMLKTVDPKLFTAPQPKKAD